MIRTSCHLDLLRGFSTEQLITNGKKDPSLTKNIVKELTRINTSNYFMPALTMKAISIIPACAIDSPEVQKFFKSLIKNPFMKGQTDQILKEFAKAATSGNKKLALQLLQFSIPLADFLHYSCIQGSIEGVKIVLEKDPTVIDVQNQENDTPLILSIRSKHVDIAFLLIEKGAKLNFVGESAMSALHWAAYYNLENVVTKLIENKANSLTKSVDGYTPLACAIFNGNKDVAKWFSEDGYTKEFIARKIVAHFNSLSGKTNLYKQDFNLTGACAPFMHKKTKEYFAKFSNQVDTHLSEKNINTLINALENASQNLPPQFYFQSIKRGNFTILPLSWAGHAFDLIFAEPYCIIANGGDGHSLGTGTISTFLYDKNKITESLVSEFFKKEDLKPDEAKYYFYDTVPKQIAFLDFNNNVVQDEICLALQSIANKPIKTGICTVACSKIALRCGVFLLGMKGLDIREAPLVAKSTKMLMQDWGTYAGIEAQIDYLKPTKSLRKTFLDWDLVDRAFEKSKNKIFKRKVSNFTIQQFKILSNLH